MEECEALEEEWKQKLKAYNELIERKEDVAVIDGDFQVPELELSALETGIGMSSCFARSMHN